MKILFVVPYYKPAFVYGGPVRSISVLCEALARAGEQVSVFTTNANGKGALDVPTGEPVDSGGVQVHYFARSAGVLPFTSPGLGRALAQRTGEFDLVQSTTLWTYPMWPTSAACRRYGVPRVESIRGGLLPHALRHKYWKKWLYFSLSERHRLNQVAAIHCTDETEREAIRTLGIRAPSFVVPNPLDWDEFSTLPARGELRARLGLAADTLLTLSLGRMAATKGLDLTARAFIEVAGRHPRAHLVFAGPDEDGSGEQARGILQQAGLADRAHFTGLVTGAGRLAALADADLFISTSRSESFGLAIAEALAAGVPVLLSDQLGIARPVAGSGAGAAVPLEVAAIARRWCELLDDPQGLRSMGARGRRFAEEQYGAEAIAQKMLEVYRRIRAGRGLTAGV